MTYKEERPVQDAPNSQLPFLLLGAIMSGQYEILNRTSTARGIIEKHEAVLSALMVQRIWSDNAAYIPPLMAFSNVTARRIA